MTMSFTEKGTQSDRPVESRPTDIQEETFRDIWGVWIPNTNNREKKVPCPCSLAKGLRGLLSSSLYSVPSKMSV